jgi:hypothetical protein
VIDQVAAVVILRGWMEVGEQAAALGQRDLRKDICLKEENGTIWPEVSARARCVLGVAADRRLYVGVDRGASLFPEAIPLR